MSTPTTVASSQPETARDYVAAWLPLAIGELDRLATNDSVDLSGRDRAVAQHAAAVINERDIAPNALATLIGVLEYSGDTSGVLAAACDLAYARRALTSVPPAVADRHAEIPLRDAVRGINRIREIYLGLSPLDSLY
jgi:hypothetical protein